MHAESVILFQIAVSIQLHNIVLQNNLRYS